MGKFTDLYSKVEEMAQDLFNENKEDFFEAVRDEGTSFDYYEFFSDKVHEDVDREFIYTGLVDCAEIIENAQEVETDSGLWDGQEPEDAIKTMAFFTLRNEVMLELRSVISSELDYRKDELAGEIESLDSDANFNKERLEKAQERFEEIEDDEQYEDEAEALEGEIDALQAEIDATDEQISDLEEMVNSIDDLQASL